MIVGRIIYHPCIAGAQLAGTTYRTGGERIDSRPDVEIRRIYLTDDYREDRSEVLFQSEFCPPVATR